MRMEDALTGLTFFADGVSFFLYSMIPRSQFFSSMTFTKLSKEEIKMLSQFQRCFEGLIEY